MISPMSIVKREAKEIAVCYRSIGNIRIVGIYLKHGHKAVFIPFRQTVQADCIVSFHAYK